jgi:hypothetical protein
VTGRVGAVRGRKTGRAPRGLGERAVSSGHHLQKFEQCVTSQNGEDGIIHEIFRRIGPQSRYFVEFGVQSGAQCNCARLVGEEGWRGLFIEADAADFELLKRRHLEAPAVRCVRAEVSSQNIEALLADSGVPQVFDLLSIDVDGNDYWIWAAVQRWHPRVVVIEYNGSYPPPRRWVMRENPAHRWNGTNYYGASLTSLAALGRGKGYTLVGTDSKGVNAFFVRSAEMTADFIDPAPYFHYTPPSYGPYGGAHPPGGGPSVEI